MIDRNQEIVDVLIRLSQGDMKARLQRSYDRGVDDAIAYCVNLLATEFERLLAEREQNVRAQRNVLEATLEALLDPVLLVDPAGLVLRGNRAASALFGLGAEALPGTSLVALATPDESAFAAGLAAHVEREAVRDRETGFRIAEGHTTLPVSASAYRDAEGQVRGIVVVIRDDRDLRAARAQLQMTDRLAAMGTIAAGVAHEINNPLAFVISNLEFLAEELDEKRLAPYGEDATELRAALEAACRGSERVRQIVQDLRTFSRADRDSFRPVDVNQLIHSTISMLDNEIRHHASVRLDLGTIPHVEANETKLGQVFLNLIHNAVQAIPPGRVSENSIRITSGTDAKGNVVVSVEDTGQGIEPGHLDRIFDAFFTTKPVGVGTGLGLSICHQVVTKLGGTISVASVVGQGTIFKVALPPSQQPAATSGSAPEVASERRRRILVIDDENEVGQSVRRILRRHHDVDAVQRADAALRLLASTSYDVILCDVMMPEMTGMEFFERLQHERPELTNQVVFMSGGAFSPEARAFLNAQKGPSLEKPFEARALRTLIDEVVGDG